MSEPTPEEQRWIGRIKELEWRAELARLVLVGDTRALSERLAQGPGPSSDPQLQRELAKLYGFSPSFGTPTATDHDEAFAGYLDELERLCADATPGPWEYADDAGAVLFGEGHQGGIVCDFPDPAADATERDATFIATARHALPKLIEKVRQWRQREADVRAWCDQFTEHEDAFAEQKLAELRALVGGGEHA